MQSRCNFFYQNNLSLLDLKGKFSRLSWKICLGKIFIWTIFPIQYFWSLIILCLTLNTLCRRICILNPCYARSFINPSKCLPVISYKIVQKVYFLILNRTPQLMFFFLITFSCKFSFLRKIHLCNSQKWKGGQFCLLIPSTFNTLTWVCIFSTLFYLHFLMC